MELPGLIHLRTRSFALFLFFVVTFVFPIFCSSQFIGNPGVFIHQKVVNDSVAQISVTTVLENRSGKRTTLLIRCGIWDNREFITRDIRNIELNDAETTSVEQDMEFGMPSLWGGPKRPFLYKIILEVIKNGKILETRYLPLGLRKFGFDKDHNFLLNNKPFPLYGVYFDDTTNNSDSTDLFLRLKRKLENVCYSGANTVLLPGHLKNNSLYSLCDSLGLIAWGNPGLKELNKNDVWWIPFDSIDKIKNPDRIYWYKARWSEDPVIFVTGKMDTVNQDFMRRIVVYCNIYDPQLEVNGVIDDERQEGSTQIEFYWDNVILNKGMNKIRVFARKKGLRAEDNWNVVVR